MSKTLRNIFILASIFAICYYLSQGTISNGEHSRDVSGRNSYGKGFDTVVLPHLNGEQLQLVDSREEKSTDGPKLVIEQDTNSAGNGFMIVDHPRLNIGHLMAMRMGQGKIDADKLNRIMGIIKCEKCPKKDDNKDHSEDIVRILNENVENDNMNNNQKRSLANGRSQWRPGKKSSINSRVNLGNGMDLIVDANVHRFWKVTKHDE